jgi:hypothetical protein
MKKLIFLKKPELPPIQIGYNYKKNNLMKVQKNPWIFFFTFKGQVI